MTAHTHDGAPSFWNRGGFWKAALVGLGYGALILVLGLIIGSLWGDYIDDDNVLADPLSLFLGAGLSIMVLGIVYAIFTARLGWWGDLLHQPTELSRRWWMWIPVVLILVWNGMRFAAADYSQFSADVIVAILVAGILIGFAEELVTRGLAVVLLRRAGFKEVWVAVLSSAIFAAMHLFNAASMDTLTVAVTVLYTFFFGICMYLTLRVGRSIVWPMVLHATTDPSGMLLQGGIDTTGDGAAEGGLAGIAGLDNYVVILAGLVLLWFIRGQVDRVHTFGLPASAQSHG